MIRVPAFVFRFDQVDSTTLYLGRCRLDQLNESAPVWQIIKISATALDYANNSTSADKVWTNRLSYTYGA